MKSTRNLFSMILALMLLSQTPTFSQTATRISGNITDQKLGEPVVGVNVIILGLVVGTVTDLDGNYSFQVREPLPLTLQVSSVGHKTIQMELTSDMRNEAGEINDLNFMLEDEVLLGQEIIVPLIIGSTIVGIAAAVLVYLASLGLIRYLTIRRNRKRILS